MTADVNAAITLPVGLEVFNGLAIVPFQTSRSRKPKMGSIVAQRGRSRGSLIVAVDPRWNPERRQRRRCAFRSWLDNVDLVNGSTSQSTEGD